METEDIVENRQEMVVFGQGVGGRWELRGSAY